MLHADVFRPTSAGGKPTPVVLLVTPYRVLASPAGNPALAYSEFNQFINAGYTIVQASLRGYGESDGCGDFGGIGEQADSKAAVEWSAEQEWSTGKVGMYGISYDGWTQIMAMANKAKGLAAAVVASPLISPYRGLYMGGVHYAQGWHATPQTYAAIDLASIGKPTPNDPQCYAENNVGTAGDDPSVDYWVERDLINAAKKSLVPVLWTHGYLDANTKPDNFLPVYSKLRGPKWAWFGQWTHSYPSDRGNGPEFVNQSIAFFDRFLKGEGAIEGGKVQVQDGSGRWREEKVWPPLDARMHSLSLNEGSYSDGPGNSASDPEASGEGVWTFSQKLPYDLRIAGISELRLHVQAERPGAHVIAMLYDVSPSGPARLITRGALKLRPQESPIGPVDAKVEVELYPQDWELEKGHRLGVFISGSDDSWFDAGTSAAEVTIVKAELRAPFLRLLPENFLPTARRSGGGTSASIAQETIVSSERKMNLPPRMR